MLRRTAHLALGVHAAMMVFGAAGILLALPNPHWWQGDALAQRTYEFGMRYGGAVQIWFGAAAMAAWGVSALGARRLLVFAVSAVSVSLTAELFGTKTGWPFGGYAYLEGLGAKVLGRVPYTIPLSWFFMGLASYALGASLWARFSSGRRSLAGGPLVGSLLLVAWDLVLDPAMAHERLPVRFWAWKEGGAYFGMPLQNFAGWLATGLSFMVLARFLWRSEPVLEGASLRVPQICYLANIAFAGTVALGVGIWEPVLVALPIAVLPALAAARARPSAAYPPGRRFLRLTAKLLLRRLDLHVEGTEHLPRSGPAVIAARHVHHLWDGVILTTLLPRPPSIVVALDWAGKGTLRRVMTALCAAAGWPVVERPDAAEPSARRIGGLREALEHLKRGAAVVVFPEGRPVYDPHAGDREDRLLPFHPGAAWLATRTAKGLRAHVPIIPMGFHYERQEGRGRRAWRVTVRAGTPILARPDDDVAALTRRIEEAVAALSSSEARVPSTELEVSPR